MKVGKEIGLLAKKQGLCRPWFAEMIKQNDIKPLCEMYFRGSDWAMENDFPNIETLRKFRDNTDKYGLFTDFQGSAGIMNIGKPQYAAFFGNSDADLICEEFSVCEIFVRHNSKLKLTVKENAIVVVNILDHGFLNIISAGAASVYYYDEKVICISTKEKGGTINLIKKSFK